MQWPVVFAFLVLTVGKCVAARHLDLFGDEAFYWQCAQRPALAYFDHPPVTALAVRLGTELLGDHPFGVRLLFLLMGAALPMTVFYLARPLVGDRDAWFAAGAALVVPAVAHLGLLAIPDVPMLLFASLFLLAVERATRQGSLLWWLLAGIFGGLGLTTHYRFILAPAAVALYLVAFREGRRPLRGQGPWLLFGTLLLGTIPAAYANIASDFGPLRYYLSGRHDGRVRPEALLEHLAGQALLGTPLLYAALIGTAIALCRRGLAGDDRARLMAVFAYTHLVFFFVASPFETSGLMTEHWPVPGYLALLPYLPGTLRRVAERGRAWRIGVWAAPSFGAMVLGLVLVELATGWPRLGAVREPFIGWTEVTVQSRKLLSSVRPTAAGRRIVVADNYKLGANLEFASRSTIDLYVLDHHKNRRHGRAPQLNAWGIDEAGLRQRVGEEALLIVEVSQILTDHHDAWIAHANSFFESLEQVAEIRIQSTGKRRKVKIFRFYQGVLGPAAGRPESG